MTEQASSPTTRDVYTAPVRLTRIIIDGVALLAAAFIVPGFKLVEQDDQVQTLISIVVLAAVFGIEAMTLEVSGKRVPIAGRAL